MDFVDFAEIHNYVNTCMETCLEIISKLFGQPWYSWQANTAEVFLLNLLQSETFLRQTPCIPHCVHDSITETTSQHVVATQHLPRKKGRQAWFILKTPSTFSISWS